MGPTSAHPLVVGPMDPDNTAELTQRYGVGNNALELLRGQADNHPPELRAILAMPTDTEGRSEALIHDEVVNRAGDLLKREGAELESAYVRGATDRTRVVTINYTVPSGRNGKASLGPWAEFSQSVAEFERVRRAKMGLAAAGAALDAPDEEAPAASPEAEAMRKLLEEQQKELAELRNPEPAPGYRQLNARDAATAVYEMDASQVDAVERYESTAGLGDGGEPRKTVVAAVEKRRADLAEQASDLAALQAARAAGNDPFAPAESGAAPPAESES